MRKFLVSIVLFFIASPALAVSVGDSVTATDLSGSHRFVGSTQFHIQTGQQRNATVMDGAEFFTELTGGRSFEFDFFGDGLTVTARGSVSLAASRNISFRFKFDDFADDGRTLTSIEETDRRVSGSFSNIGNVGISFEDDTFTLDYGGGYNHNFNDFVTYEFQTTAAVPIPASLGFLAFSVLGLGWFVRRRSGLATP